MGEAPAILAEGLVKTYGTTTRRWPGWTWRCRPARSRPARAQRRGQDHRRPHARHPAAPDRGPGARWPGTTWSTRGRRRCGGMIGLTGQYAARGRVPDRPGQPGHGRPAVPACRERAPGARADELLERFGLTEAADRRGQDLLRRHAPPAGPGRQPDRPPAGAVPGRADHRPGPAQPRTSLGDASASWSRDGHDGAAHHAVPGRGRPAGRRDRGHRPRHGDRRRARPTSSRPPSAASASRSSWPRAPARRGGDRRGRRSPRQRSAGRRRRGCRSPAAAAEGPGSRRWCARSTRPGSPVTDVHRAGRRSTTCS